jgi:predicted nucleic acid-binding protein
LLDNSAWARLADPRVPADRAAAIANALEDGRVATCLPFELEAGFSARSRRDYDVISSEIASLPRFAIDAVAEQRALVAQAQLARTGHHRVPPVDLIIAAVADREGIGILHYDADYDLLREKTDLRFESDWLVPRGTI